MLNNLTIAVPESRQLDLLAGLLEARQANVLRVPLISIHDAPDSAPVLAWVRDFISRPPDSFIILTGEGVRRLMSLCQKHDLGNSFVEALSATVKICRGPKPVRALSEIGVKDTVPAAEPTTEGVIATLEAMDISGTTVAVQLYGEDPNQRLIDYLTGRNAHVNTVAPYIYADRSEEEAVVQLIHQLARGEIDAIAFTSQPQVKRLQQVARRHDLLKELDRGLEQTVVAAVGPVVRDQLEKSGIQVSVMPERTYFMKPLVTALDKHFTST